MALFPGSGGSLLEGIWPVLAKGSGSLSIVQPKAPTEKKLKKKKISSSSKPKTSKNVRRSKPKKIVIETQYTEDSVATIDTTKSLETSESAEDIVNHPKTNYAKKVMDIQEKDKNRSQIDKTEHENKKIVKEKSSQSQPREVDLERAWKTEPENLNCQKERRQVNEGLRFELRFQGKIDGQDMLWFSLTTKTQEAHKLKTWTAYKKRRRRKIESM
ncbi:hypothetical protein Tco_1492129 [Tanacetum coccineum]